MTTKIVQAYHLVHPIRILEPHQHKERIKVQALSLKHMLKEDGMAESQAALRGAWVNGGTLIMLLPLPRISSS